MLEPRISDKKLGPIKFFEQISDNSGDDSEEIIVIDSDDDYDDDSSSSIDSDDDDGVGDLSTSINSAAVENAAVGQVSTNLGTLTLILKVEGSGTADLLPLLVWTRLFLC